MLPTLPRWIPPLDTGQPAAETLNKVGEVRQFNLAAANTPIPITWGRDRIPGQIFVVHVDEAAGFLYVGYTFGTGEIQAFEAIYVDGIDVNLEGGFMGHVGAELEQYLGTQSQTVSPLLSAAITGYTDALLGTAYVVLKVPQGATQGFPRCEAIVFGRKVYDPRNSAVRGDNITRLAQTGTPTGTQPTSVTIEAWVKNRPGWDADATTHVIFREGTAANIGVRLNSNSGSGNSPQFVIGVNAGGATRTLTSSRVLNDNEVYHIAATYNSASGQRVMRLYINGELDSSLDLSGESFSNWNISWSGNPVIEIGVDGFLEMQDVRYWSIQRTAAEIRDNFRKRQHVLLASLIGYWPIYETSGTTFDDKTTNNNNMTKDASATIVTAFVGLKPNLNSSAQSPTVYSFNPTVCFADFVTNFTSWEIDYTSVIENAAFNDETVGLAPRRVIGLTMYEPASVEDWAKAWRVYMGAFLGWEDGYIKVIPNRESVDAQGALTLNGTSTAYASIADQADLDFNSTASFTLEAWFQTSLTAVTQVILSKKNVATDATAGYAIYLNSSNQLVVRIADGTNQAADTTTLTYADGVWHHVAVSVDLFNNSMIMYVDGVARTAVTITSIGSLENAIGFFVGAQGSGANRFNGSIDEVRVWTSIRTAQQITDYRFIEIADPSTAFSGTLASYWKFNDLVGTTALDRGYGANNLTLTTGAGFGPGHGQVIPDGVVRHFVVDTIVKDSLTLNKRSSRQFPTVVQVEYTDETTNMFRVERQEARAPGVLNGSQPARYSRVSLPGIHNPSQAKREAVERLNWFLSDLEVTFRAFDEGLELQQGSVIAVTHPLGLDGKLFRVRQITGQSGRWVIDAVEYDPAIYSNLVIATPSTPDTNLGNPTNPPLVTALTATEELFRYRNGITGSRVRVTWTSNYPFASQYLVEGFVSGVRVWQQFVATNEAVSPPVEELVGTAPVPYNVHVSIVTPFAIGTPEITTVTIQGKLAPPGNVPQVRATLINGNTAEVDWDEATDIDIWRYEVRVGTTAGSWETAEFVELVDGLVFTATGLPLGTSRLFVKAVDTVGNVSPVATYADVTTVRPSTPTTLTGFELGGEVRLSWAANPAVEFVDRYRVAYYNGVIETTLDTTDSLRLSTRDVLEGTFTFRVYAVNAQGESLTPASLVIQVSSDASVFIGALHNFEVEPGGGGGGTGAWGTSWNTNWGVSWGGGGSSPLSNIHTWILRDHPTTGKKFFVTSMGDQFDATAPPHDFDTETVALANYHDAGFTQWISETKDFGIPLTGTWVLTHDAVALDGDIAVTMELSPDNVVWSAFPTLTRGTFRYARVKIVADGNSTAFIMTPVVRVHCAVVPVEESGFATSNSSSYYRIELAREYSAVSEINVQVRNITEGRTHTVDNVQVGKNTGVRGYGLAYFNGGGLGDFNFGPTQNFTIEFWLKNNMSAFIGGIVAKRAVAGVGFEILADESSNQLTINLHDGTNSFTQSTGFDSFPEDGVPHHYAFTVDRSADQVRIYIDGVQHVSSPFSISSLTGSLVSSADFLVMNDSTGGNASRSTLDELRIWSVVRTSGEITANKDREISPTSANLIGYWRCNGVFGATVNTLEDEITFGASTKDLVKQTSGSMVYEMIGGPVVRINSFDVYIFDVFGQQLGTDFQWNWKGV